VVVEIVDTATLRAMDEEREGIGKTEHNLPISLLKGAERVTVGGEM
jgi:hypothetical protein